MISAIAGTLLALAISIHSDDLIPEVERCEINTVGGITQVILWTHESTGGKYRSRVSQWWIVAGEPMIEHRKGWLVIQNRGAIFKTKRLSTTETPYDPEIRDRDFLPTEDRVPYLKLPE
jgi:hypothetical protein